MDISEAMSRVVEHLGGEVNPRRGWTSIKCVSNSHDDQRASARIYYEEGGYKCLACGLSAGSPLQLLQRALGLDDAGAFKLYEGVTAGEAPGISKAVRGESGRIELLGEPRAFEKDSGGISRWIRVKPSDGR